MGDTQSEINRKVSRQGLAEHYGVSTRCVSNWQAAGIIPFTRIGKRIVRFDLNEVEAALEKYKVKVFDRAGKEVKP
jgi:phage terminase Nu1 subunit (DNA packaging protein)